MKGYHKMHLRIKPSNCIFALIGSAVLAFGLYNIHSFSGVTEGGVLGLTLLLHHWFGISPSMSGLILNIICYAIGFKLLGKEFIAYSVFAGVGFSAFYAFFERFDPLWPELVNMPLAAAVVGALFVGIGVGICVRANSAPSGDDALAMSLSSVTGLGIAWIYFISDAVVLLMSLSYIPLLKLAYSLLTVILSGQIIALIQKIKLPKKKAV